MTLRLVPGGSPMQLPGAAELKLLEGLSARLRHRHDGTPVLGSVAVEIHYATNSQESLPVPTLKTWGVIGDTCQHSSNTDGRDGRIVVSMDEAIAWSGLQWYLLSAPLAIRNQFMSYIDEVNLRTVRSLFPRGLGHVPLPGYTDPVFFHCLLTMVNPF